MDFSSYISQSSEKSLPFALRQVFSPITVARTLSLELVLIVIQIGGGGGELMVMAKSNKNGLWFVIKVRNPCRSLFVRCFLRLQLQEP